MLAFSLSSSRLMASSASSSAKDCSSPLLWLYRSARASNSSILRSMRSNLSTDVAVSLWRTRSCTLMRLWALRSRNCIACWRERASTSLASSAPMASDSLLIPSATASCSCSSALSNSLCLLFSSSAARARSSRSRLRASSALPCHSLTRSRWRSIWRKTSFFSARKRARLDRSRTSSSSIS